MANTYQVVDGADGGGGGGASAYSETFTGLSWAGPTSGEYTITILQSTHNTGTTPVVQVFEDNAGIFDLVALSIRVNALGDVTISVGAIPDSRFSGRVVII